MRKRTVEFQYEPRSPYVMYMRIAEWEMEGIDHFLELACNAREIQQQELEQLVAKTCANVPDDWFVDDFAQLDDFAALAAEFAIIGLWRCAELYRKRVILYEFGQQAAARTFRHRDFQNELSRLGVVEARIRCARSVDELRCLNNAIKHEQRVNGELKRFQHWRSKTGNKLGNLEVHYHRLRPRAERYLEDLTNRLDRRWKRQRMHNQSLQRTTASGVR